MTGIYQIQSKIKPERIYIGSAVNIRERWHNHLSFLKRGDHASIKLQNHFNKYGKDDLIFTILIGCDKEDLLTSEQFYLDSKIHWFNICQIAGNSLGTKRTEEIKKKISERLKGNKYNLGRRWKMSEEGKQNVSNGRKGVRMSEEARKHISEIRKEYYKTERGIAIINNLAVINKGHKYGLGKKLSEETKRKISESETGIKNANYGKKWPLEVINKMRLAKLGKKASEETRKKLSEAQKQRWTNQRNATL